MSRRLSALEQIENVKQEAMRNETLDRMEEPDRRERRAEHRVNEALGSRQYNPNSATQEMLKAAHMRASNAYGITTPVTTAHRAKATLQNMQTGSATIASLPVGGRFQRKR